MRTIDEKTGDESAGMDPVKKEPTPTIHDLDAETVARGGVTFADYSAADIKTMPDGTEINALAWAAAGKTTGDREIGAGERQQNALKIDAAVRSHASWLGTRPLMEQMMGMVQPVIYVGPNDPPAS